MMDVVLSLIMTIVTSVVTVYMFYLITVRKGAKERDPSAVDVSKEAVALAAKARAKELVVEAKDNSMKIIADAQKEASRIKADSEGLKRKLSVRSTQLQAKEKELMSKEDLLREERESLVKRKKDLEDLHSVQRDKLQQVANLTKDEARKRLLESFERELIEEKSRKLREIEGEIKRTSEEKAKEILVDAMRRGATDYVVEHTVSKVKLPDDDMKGRIIGKEGRNIRAFEEKTGVELELDSSPGEVLISSFDPVRREIARFALEKLIADGRIQPARIEEIVSKTQQEVGQIMFKEGDNLCHRVGVYNLPKELVQMIGKFKYRFSYGQNMIEHTLEETKIGIAIAYEIGADVDVVRLGCLLHDIGKVITDEEGTHVQLGVDLLKKHDVRKEVIDCVGEHHEDKPFSSIESAIVNLADHVSGARPGSRSEDYESYVKRLKDLEDAAYSFDGVEKVYAISAGREVRIFVNPESVDDASTALLAREIARKIELEQTYPGIVKVVVIRETRVSETAK